MEFPKIFQRTFTERDKGEQVKDHPLLGSGLGNWKIASIAYGKEHVNGYTVPYHAHNDFLQFAAELGFLVSSAIRDCLPSSLLFCTLFRKRTRSSKEENGHDPILALTVYVVDAGLNFPVARPLMQSVLLWWWG